MWQWTWWRTIWNFRCWSAIICREQQSTDSLSTIEYSDVQTKLIKICWCNQLSGEQWTDNSLVLRGSHLKIRTGQQSAYKSCHSAAPLYSSLTALRRCRRQLQLRPRKFRIAATVARVVAILPLNLSLNLAKKSSVLLQAKFYQLPNAGLNQLLLFIHRSCVFESFIVWSCLLVWDPP